MSDASSLASLQVRTIVSVPFDENTYVFWVEGQKEAVVVDPGLQPGKIVDLLNAEGLTPVAVLLTHGHTDHIAGNQRMKEVWPECPLLIGEGDAYKLTDPEANLSANYGFSVISPPADKTLVEGDTYQAAGLHFEVLETPGHSAGHITFVLKYDENTHLISGDVLFRDGIGRSDFPDGDTQALLDSIVKKLFTQPDDAIVYTGHGPLTTIGEEKVSNPYVGQAAR